jgi:hypothetical protein
MMETTMDSAPNKLYSALLAAQRAMGPLTKNAQNPHLKNKYADLSAVLTTIEQPLWENGLVMVQRFDGVDGPDGHSIPVLITELVHAESGQSVKSTALLLCKEPNDPQKMGSAITYYRRYSLMSLLGLTAEDDDGNSAARPAPPRQIERGKPEPYHEMHFVESAPRPASPAAPASAQPGQMRVVDRPVDMAARLDTDQVLAILGEMDDSREPWHEIKRYADDQSDGREGDDVLRIHDKLRAIASRRKAAAPAPAATPPANHAG